MAMVAMNQQITKTNNRVFPAGERRGRKIFMTYSLAYLSID